MFTGRLTRKYLYCYFIRYVLLLGILFNQVFLRITPHKYLNRLNKVNKFKYDLSRNLYVLLLLKVLRFDTGFRLQMIVNLLVQFQWWQDTSCVGNPSGYRLQVRQVSYSVVNQYLMYYSVQITGQMRVRLMKAVQCIGMHCF